MKRLPFPEMLALASLLVGACDDGRSSNVSFWHPPDFGTVSPGPGSSDGAVHADPADLSTPLAAYPAGPYGNQIGETIADFDAPGYLANHSWSNDLKLSDLRANPACKCILVTLGATWCGACQSEQPDLVSDVASDPAFCVLGILQEGPSMALPTRPDVDAWEGSFNQNFPVMQGNATTEQLLSGYGSSVGLPFGFLVDPVTMKVLDNVQGYSPDLHTYAKSVCHY